jgi:UDP-2-acetamido-2-deoxy-ribo-hexuluronate aminotransferase
MDLLLDAASVCALSVAPPSSPQPLADAIIRCTATGGRVWLYAGAVQPYLSALIEALGSAARAQSVPLSPSALNDDARQRLGTLARDKQWLAALGTDIDIPSTDDAGTGQMLRAVERIGPDRMRLLTSDPGLRKTHPDLVTDPAAFLAQTEPSAQTGFIDLATQQRRIRAPLEAGLHRVLHHGRYVMGPEIAELEQRLADYVGVAHCVAVSSGTDALLIALMALGIGPGDEVITTPFTFVATAEVIALRGAVPKFVDIDPRTYNIDPTLIESAIGPRTRAIMPVSLYGQCADMDAINDIAARHGLPVIEDAAQSFGATFRGRRSGGLSTIGCTSFFPSKPLGCYGDGGACFTDDDALAEAMRQIMNHGQDRRYSHARLGINGRLDSMQAAILLAKLDVFDDELRRRTRAADAYGGALRPRGAKTLGDGEAAVLLPYVEPHNTSAFAQYTLQLDDRETAQHRLQAAGIPTAIHYPIPLNRQVAYRDYCCPDCTPIADSAAARVLSLPMHPYLSGEQVDAVAAALMPDGQG